jgi:hypothetical protein
MITRLFSLVWNKFWLFILKTSLMFELDKNKPPFSTHFLLSTYLLCTSHIDNVQKFKVYDLFEVSFLSRILEENRL